MNTPYRGCILRQFEDLSSLGSDEAALLARLEQNPDELITFSGFDRAYLETRSDWARQITA